MTRPYDWNPMPHVLDVRCPKCTACARFEFATVARIERRQDVPFFVESDQFEYALLKGWWASEWREHRIELVLAIDGPSWQAAAMKKTYKGSCQCGSVRFEADIDLEKGTGKCNCTSCWKRRWWSVRVSTDAFRSLGGEENLSGYRPGSAEGHSGFCRNCGVRPYAWVDAAEWNDGAYVSINVACLDDLDPAELLAAPVQYFDGRADNWWKAPAETRHL